MATTYAFSARNSRILISSTVYLYARRWSIAARVDELDVATFEEYGFTNYEDGLMDADVSVDAFWSVLNNTNGIRAADGSSGASMTPPLIYPGATIAGNYFYVKGTGNGAVNGLGSGGGNSNLSYYFPFLKLFTASTDGEVRNTLNVSFTAKNQGQFYFPGQLASVGSNPNPRAIWH